MCVCVCCSQYLSASLMSILMSIIVCVFVCVYVARKFIILESIWFLIVLICFCVYLPIMSEKRWSSVYTFACVSKFLMKKTSALKFNDMRLLLACLPCTLCSHYIIFIYFLNGFAHSSFQRKKCKREENKTQSWYWFI